MPSNAVTMYDPVVDAFREISRTNAEIFIASAADVEAKLTANPSLQIISMFDPAINAYREIGRARALQYVNSAKDVQKLL
jgi:hypothetical protein